MSAAHLVPQNFRYLIEKLQPTNFSGDGHCRRRFRWVDPERVDPDTSAGMARSFTVRIEGIEEDRDEGDLKERVADFMFILEVTYPTEWEAEKLNTVVLQDRHDLRKLLRNTDYYVGTADNSTADLGLWSRVCEGEEIDREDYTLILRQSWRCIIKETE